MSLERVYRKLKPLVVKAMPLAEKPPKNNHFGRPLNLNRVHWVKPVLVAQVNFLTWTGDGLLRQVTYQGLREDKPATSIVRERPA
jgi:bifunctional non-homologous end joining protein LigD